MRERRISGRQLSWLREDGTAIYRHRWTSPGLPKLSLFPLSEYLLPLIFREETGELTKGSLAFSHCYDGDDTGDQRGVIRCAKFEKAKVYKLTPSSVIRCAKTLRQRRIPRAVSGLFNRRDESICIPIRYAPRRMNPHELGHRRVRGISNVALMMKLVPEFSPRCLNIIAAFKQAKCRARIVW